MNSKILFTLALTFSLISTASRAEEGGSGHYTPGATASFIDALPGYEAFACLNEFTYYNGAAGASRQIAFGRNIAIDIKGTVYADTTTLLYQTPWKFLGGEYAAALAIPYVWTEVKGNVQAGPVTGNRRDTTHGIGDIEILPFMLGWTCGDIKIGTTLGVYAPTGGYDSSQLASVGKNYWTFEPGANVSWLSSKTGTEVSLFTGFDFSTENNTTHYRSGDVFHLDATVAQHLPLFGGLIGVGANVFYYRQISPDNGSSAKLGNFEGQTVGIGPVISYTRKVGRTNIVAEVKWLPELQTEKRLNGDTIWFKMAVVF